MTVSGLTRRRAHSRARVLQLHLASAIIVAAALARLSAQIAPGQNVNMVAGGTWPNEPSGLTLLSDWGMDQQPPFSGDSELAVLWAHLQETPPKASERAPQLPVAVDGVVARALAKKQGTE